MGERERERDTGEKERERRGERERQTVEKERKGGERKKLHGILSCRASIRLPRITLSLSPFCSCRYNHELRYLCLPSAAADI